MVGLQQAVSSDEPAPGTQLGRIDLLDQKHAGTVSAENLLEDRHNTVEFVETSERGGNRAHCFRKGRLLSARQYSDIDLGCSRLSLFEVGADRRKARLGLIEHGQQIATPLARSSWFD